MKSKKLLLGALMALAIGTSAMNLFADDAQQLETCKWHLDGNCSSGWECIWYAPATPFTYCDENACLEALSLMEPC